MEIKLGMSPISWTNDDLPELGGDTSLETCLKETRLAGFSGTELGGKFPKNPSSLKEVLEEHELKLISGWYSGTMLNNSLKDEKIKLDETLNLFAEVGASVLVYGETFNTVQNKKNKPLNSRPRLSEFDIKQYGQDLGDLADYCLDKGVPLTFHHHMGTAVETQNEIEQLMNSTRDSVGLLLDTGHLLFADGDYDKIISNYGDRINHIHTKDIRKDVFKNVDKSKDSFLDCVLDGVFTVPGDGCIDYRKFIKRLKDIRYKGWIVIEAEQDPLKANPFEYAKKGFNTLVSFLEEYDFKIIA